MTAIVEINLVCNGRGRGTTCPTREFLVYPTQSIKSARNMAANKGWKVYRETVGTGTKTRDACPACSAIIPGVVVRDVDRHQPAMSAAQMLGDALDRRKKS